MDSLLPSSRVLEKTVARVVKIMSPLLDKPKVRCPVDRGPPLDPAVRYTNRPEYIVLNAMKTACEFSRAADDGSYSQKIFP
jgi:hypothetical protein